MVFPRPVYLLCDNAQMVCFGDGMIVIDLIIIVYLGCWSCPWAGQPALAAQWQGSTAMSVCMCGLHSMSNVGAMAEEQKIRGIMA